MSEIRIEFTSVYLHIKTSQSVIVKGLPLRRIVQRHIITILAVLIRNDPMREIERLTMTQIYEDNFLKKKE